ncbi:MAG: siderophore ABC transporter substrate-binding protein [Chloroflexi bacterium]|nr:siderophore ABC transporter substrate-binding protein [Chloroflexota bacterium]
MKRLSSQLVMLLLIGAALAACSGPATPVATTAPAAATTAPTAATADKVTISHAQGETTVARNPKKVVVFDYSVLDTLDKLGVPVAAVPQANLPGFLAKYKGAEYANAGSLFEPDYEKINSLKPDLIIVASRSAPAYKELSKIAPTIDATIDQKNFIPSFKTTATNLGLIFGKDDEVKSRLAAIDAAIARTKAAAAVGNRKALIILSTGGEVTAFGPGSRFGLIHDVLGVPPVVTDIQEATHGNAISFEFIQEKNPDILYVIDRDRAVGQTAQPAKQVLDNELMARTKAAMNNKIAYLDPDTWYLASGGIGTVASMVGEIEASLK